MDSRRVTVNTVSFTWGSGNAKNVFLKMKNGEPRLSATLGIQIQNPPGSKAGAGLLRLLAVEKPNFYFVSFSPKLQSALSGCRKSW
jgi:hypothetical protein